MTLSVFMLLLACYLIRRIIKSLQTPFPNEIFIRIHLVNFIVYTLLNTAMWVIGEILISAVKNEDDLRITRSQYAMTIVCNI